MAQATQYISQIQAPNGEIYKIKDAEARELLTHSLELQVVTQLPAANASTKGKIYLKSHTHNPSSGSSDGSTWKDVYDEYITVEPTTGVYQWEKIGNTDINLSAYSVVGHTHTLNVSIAHHNYKPAGSVSISSSTNKKYAVDVSTAGTTTYRPAGTVGAAFVGDSTTFTVTGTVSGTTNSSGSHTHTLNSTTNYLHTTEIAKTYNTLSNVARAASTGYLVTSTMPKPNGSVGITGVTYVDTKKVAIVKSTNTSVSYVTSAAGTVTINGSTTSVVDGVSTGAVAVSQGSNSVMWDIVVNSSECMSFVFKPFTTKAVLNSDTSASTSAHAVTISTVGTRLYDTSVDVSRFKAAANVSVLKVTSGTITYATGSTSTGGNAAQAVITKVATATALSSTPSASVSPYTSLDTSATNGTAVVISVSTGVNAGGSHSHTVSTTNASASTTITYTPTGTVNASFQGTSVRLETELIKVPTGLSFSGTLASIGHTIYGASTGYRVLTTQGSTT